MEISNIILMVLVTFLFVLFFIPVVKEIALHVGALDIPNERKVHKKPIPRLGGLGIYCGFLIGYVIFGHPSIQMNSILIGSFIIVITGIIDDIKPIKARYKLMGQVIGASVVPLFGGIVLKDISAFGLYVNFGVFSYPITILFIVSIINSLNLIDGLDGLAGGIASIYFLMIGIISIILNNSSGLDTILTFIMLGCTLGFLVHNFYPATIFMGDSGSMFLGYIIAVISLLGYKNVTFTSLIVPIFLLAIPIVDTALAIIRRLIKHESIATPDKNHLHHRLLRFSMSVRKTVLIIYFIDILFAIASLIYVTNNRVSGIIIYVVILILVLLLLYKVNNIYKKNEGGKR